MKYLIDTQILIWFQTNDIQLKPQIKEILDNQNNQILVSDVSLYEISIKKVINKLPDLPATIEDIIFVINDDGFEFLPINHKHILSYNLLPLNNEHRDPFDRLIISTAISGNLPVISSDQKFKLYKNFFELIEA